MNKTNNSSTSQNGSSETLGANARRYGGLLFSLIAFMLVVLYFVFTDSDNYVRNVGLMPYVGLIAIMLGLFTNNRYVYKKVQLSAMICSIFFAVAALLLSSSYETTSKLTTGYLVITFSSLTVFCVIIGRFTPSIVSLVREIGGKQPTI